MDRWTHSQVQESEPAGSAPPTHNSPCTLFPGKPQAFLPWLSPRKDMGEQPQGRVIVSSLLPLRSTNSYPPTPSANPAPFRNL